MKVAWGMMFVYDIYFYKDKNGKEPVYELLKELTEKRTKTAESMRPKLQTILKF